MVDDCAALPIGIVGRDAFAYFSKLPPRIVEELVVNRSRRRAELLLCHPAAGIVSNPARV